MVKYMSNDNSFNASHFAVNIELLLFGYSLTVKWKRA